PVVIGDFQSVGSFEVATSLRRDEKGINMSRILESLESENQDGVPLDFTTLGKVLDTLKERMNQENAEITADGKWYFTKSSPDTQLGGMAHADVKYSLELNGDRAARKQLGMTAMVTTLCPCS